MDICTEKELTNNHKHYFTREEANNMIPQLEATFHRIIQMHGQIRLLYHHLEKLGFAPENDDFDLHPNGANQEVSNHLSSLRVLLDELQTELGRLQTNGCIVKDIEAGLVDWYARYQGRDVFLSWRLGEKSVAHWHEVEGGHRNRQPLMD